MIPSRPVFETWRPDSLGPAVDVAKSSSETVDQAGWEVVWEISGLNNNENWDGLAYRAAGDMAGRVRGQTSTFGNLGMNVEVGVHKFGATLAAEHRAISDLVRIIESGDLYVTDDWTVLVREKVMSPAMAKLLVLAATGFQDQLNPHLMSLGHADYDLGNFIRSETMSVTPGLPELWCDRNAPKDATTDPYSDETRGEDPTRGRENQQKKLAEHMMGTVVDKGTTSEDGKTVTTLRMLDGSSQVYTDAHRGGVGDTFDLYNERGKLVSTKVNNPDGSIVTTLTRDGKSPIVVRETKDGKAVADVDGVQVQVPGTKDVAQALAGGGMAALEPHVAKGFPYLTAPQAEKLVIGTKAAGPALTILGTAISVADAKNGYDKCVATTAGSVSLAGDLAMMVAAPEGAGALKTFGITAGSSLAFGMAGSFIGRAVCK